jgi:metal-dependent amidase/aminoacylase/carboxypeptidase family protein
LDCDLPHPIVSRNVPAGEMTVVTIGKFQSGDAPNAVAPNSCFIGNHN